MARRPKKRVAKRHVGRRPRRPARQESRAVPPPPPRHHNLPTQLTTFIGREREIAEVKRLLASARLLTLTGAGGAGKTRLALRVAADCLEQYPDGVWFVDLAPLADSTFVPSSVAAVLGVPEQPTRPLIDTLADYLRTRTLLVILDNCEHLRPASQSLADHLLRACETLRILATSREGLGVDGESTYRVPSLRLPGTRQALSVTNLAEYDAIRLFAERGALSQPGFTVTASNAQAIMDICQRLDGMPLAIEFAAARVAALPIGQIAARLDDRFRLLTAESRKALPRQQTLRATLDWSHDLLSPSEQTLFRRLSVFAGGFTLEAAETICAGVGERDILNLLTRLVNKSLVVLDDREGQARYRLLESVRQYGRDKLQESGETDHVLRQHRDWYLQFAEEANPKLRGHEQDIWLDRLETEHDNLRAALAWSKTARDGVEAWMRLAGALHWFWYINGHWSEGRRWLEDALSAGEAARPSVLWETLRGASRFAFMQGDFDRQRELVERMKAVCETLDDTQAESAQFLLRVHMGHMALEVRDVARGVMLHEENLAAAREFGDKWNLAFAHFNLAYAVREQGDHERALHLSEEGARLFEEVGDKWRLSMMLRDIGIIFLRQRNYDRAATFYADSIRLRDPLKNRLVVFQSLEGLACIACARGRRKQAAILFGAAKPIQEHLRSTRDPDYEMVVDQYLQATRTSLGEPGFERAWAEGRALTLQEAVEYALAQVEPTKPAGQRPQCKRPNDDPLTAREREVVRLVARGLTNREIAETLVVSRRTADAHVQNILNKLGFGSRAQIAVWAEQRGLNGKVEAETTRLDASRSQPT
jgi:predicted ATPase/DNA-binding CsgD family transcriptional regulator